MDEPERHLLLRRTDAEFALIEERHRDQLERLRDAIRRNHAGWDSLERTMRDGFARLHRSLDEIEFRLKEAGLWVSRPGARSPRVRPRRRKKR